MNLVMESQKTGSKRRDPLRRWMPTPFVADLSVMGRTVRLQTNSPSIHDRLQDLFARYPKAASGPSDFLWKIVCEAGPQVRPPWPEISAYSDKDLRMVTFGQHSFLAIDLAAREAVGTWRKGCWPMRRGSPARSSPPSSS